MDGIVELDRCTTYGSDDMEASAQSGGASIPGLANGAIHKVARPRPIKPRPAGMPIVVEKPVAAATRVQKHVVTAEELARRAERRQARRERNRLAAARSNERRRLKHVGLKTDIANERERARELLERLRLVTAENAQLRQELGDPSGKPFTS